MVADRSKEGAIEADLRIQNSRKRTSSDAFSPISPKKPQTETAGLADIFPYYAGFSYEWAFRTLSAHAHGSGIVLDPWNGSGTTTLAAGLAGLPSVGVDLNPVANIVAQLRTSSDPAIPVMAPKRVSSNARKVEPLLSWFEPESARRLRAWSETARHTGGSSGALLWVSLFRAVRELTRDFQGSNPTWVRKKSAKIPGVVLSTRKIDALIMGHQEVLCERLDSRGVVGTNALIAKGNATSLPIASNVVDVVLTSPPYLTRIDYAVAYSRELAVLGVDITSDRSLRQELMGTTLIRPEDARSLEFQGSLASALVEKVAAHESHASGVYYLKQVCQYLHDLTRSFDEITRVCKSGALATFVVQDSYYKDVPVLLADICEEEALIRGWATVDKQPFEVVRTLTSLNSAARAYPKGRVNETVITLKKG